MKRYTGKLEENIQEIVQNHGKFLNGLMAPAGLSGAKSETYTIDETVKKYNPGITEDEIKAWVWYRRKKGVPMHSWKSYFVKDSERLILKWLKAGVLFYDPTEKGYVPYAAFIFGNIYTKISKLKRDKEALTDKFGEAIYQKQLKTLEKMKPAPLSVSNPIESERPVILAISKFAKEEFTVKTLRESSGVILEREMSLQEAFSDYLRSLSDEEIKGTSSFYIINYYLANENKPRNIDKGEWQKIKKVTRTEGERLFKIFLHEALEMEDQNKIDVVFNSQYNATAPLQYQKIPIGLEVSRSFMGNSLEVRRAQREGIAFMELVGSGIVAYDVGVGKTITAIIEVAGAIKNGKCKRPLIAVPNPTYKNWLKEMEGVDDLSGVLSGTGITVNDWFNLGAKYDHINLDKAVPENSVTLVSYEGLMKIGFNEHTQNDHFTELSKIVGQSENASERDIEKQKEKFREIIGTGLKETTADIETLGFDYVVIDEAHNFKNIFSEVKSEKKAGKQFHVKGGSPSNRAIKAFFLCNYIQRAYGRNVMLLSATPFTNSPLEIYSMLSLVAYQYMKNNNIENLTRFFEQYISETSEYVVGVEGEIKQKNVVKSFNNRISLQKLINSHINFKTGEEANIPRPCKVNLPKTTENTPTGLKKLPRDEQVLTYLQMADEQAEIQQIINSKASEGASRDDPGRLLSLMADSQNNALSPFLVGKSEQSHMSAYSKGNPKDYLDFVNASPKIKYTLDCIATVKKYHEKNGKPVSGQVIYIDRGKEYFKYIKEFLEVELGYKKNQALKSNPRQKVDEVEVMQGGMTPAKKEKIKDAFNDGTCKVLIGTSSIKEGVNLQENATVLYNLYPNWNPTDIRQLEGRVWRQKNKFNFVRIAMPLMENSMDVFVFQKLEEKTSRINDLWNKSDRGNVLDEESLDPNEVKFALVTDLQVLLKFELSKIKEEMAANVNVLEKRIEALSVYNETQNSYRHYKEIIIDDIHSAISRFGYVTIGATTGYDLNFSEVSSMKSEELNKAVKDKFERATEIYAGLKAIEQGNHTDKEIIQAYGKYARFTGNSYNWNFTQFKNRVSQLGKMKRSLFQNRGYDENTDLDVIRKEMESELEALQKEQEDIRSDEFQEKIYNDIVEQKQKFGVKGASIAERVKQFSKMNNLLEYKFDKKSVEECAIPTGTLKKPKSDKTKRLRIAKAKAKALKIKLQMAA